MPEPEPDPEPEPAPAPEPDAAPAPLPSGPAFAEVAGCSCKARLGKRNLVVSLAVSAIPQADGGGTSLDWRLELPGGDSLPLATRRDTAPPGSARGNRPVALGIACRGDTLAVVAGDSVSVWSLRDGRARWTRPLGRPYRPTDEPPDGAIAACARLPVNGALLRVPLRRGRVKVDLDKGTVRD